MPDMAPLVRTLQVQVDATAQAATSTTEVGEAPFDGTVTGVRYVPSAAVTGAATNNRTFTLVNKGQAGAGSTVLATLTLASGTNLVASDASALALQGTPSFVQGDVLAFVSTANGTGLADPGGVVAVDLTRS